MNSAATASLVTVLGALALTACRSTSPREPSAHNASPQAQTAPQSSAAPAAEPCRVFTIFREPTVATEKVATLVVHGKEPGALVTITEADGGPLHATTAAEVEDTICRVLPARPYLLHVMSENGNRVGDIYTPTASPDAAADARVLCDAERAGMRLGGKGDERLSLGLQQAAGGLTTPKYRELLFGTLHGDQSAMSDLLERLERDIRAQGDTAWERCTLLVKK